MSSPSIQWQTGTAADLFASIYVLHHPARFGLRGAWAKGVRARLNAADRETLSQTSALIVVPISWLRQNNFPQNGKAVLTALTSIPTAERLRRLLISPASPPIFEQLLLQDVWVTEQTQALRSALHDQGKNPPRAFFDQLAYWAQRQTEFGERYLAALRAYHQAFFAEEEARISPVLVNSIQSAQLLAQSDALPELLEKLSQGVRFSWAEQAQQVVLMPSFWITPLVVWEEIDQPLWGMVFGARSENTSLVPGEMVSDRLLNMLKALSDPTRLRILRYLTEQGSTPSHLARRLRLRAPTVVHHLNVLRLAGLVVLEINPQGARRYQARSEQIQAVGKLLTDFLHGEE